MLMHEALLVGKFKAVQSSRQKRDLDSDEEDEDEDGDSIEDDFMKEAWNKKKNGSKVITVPNSKSSSKVNHGMQDALWNTSSAPKATSPSASSTTSSTSTNTSASTSSTSGGRRGRGSALSASLARIKMQREMAKET